MLKKLAQFIGLLIGVCCGFVALVAMMTSENTAVVFLGVVIVVVGMVGALIWLIKVMLKSAKKKWDDLPIVVSTELLTTETVGIGRGASAAIGSLLGGNLGMFAGAVGGGRKQYATFLVTYSDGTVKNEQVKVNTPTYNLYMSLRGK